MTAAMAAAMAARLALISDLVASTQMQAAAVAQAAARLVDTTSNDELGGACEATDVAADVAADRVKVQAWLEDTTRLASLLSDVNHPAVKGLAAGLDALTDSVRRRLNEWG